MKAKLSIYNAVYTPSEHDGDTFHCTGDIRPITPDTRTWTPKVRLAGIDTPERGELGWTEARDHLNQWLEAGPFNLLCYGRDKYGRLLADAERGEGLLSAHMLSSGHAEPASIPRQLADHDTQENQP